MYFYGLRGCQTQGPPRAAHTLATPLFIQLHFTMTLVIVTSSGQKYVNVLTSWHFVFCPNDFPQAADITFWLELSQIYRMASFIFDPCEVIHVTTVLLIGSLVVDRACGPTWAYIYIQWMTLATRLGQCQRFKHCWSHFLKNRIVVNLLFLCRRLPRTSGHQMTYAMLAAVQNQRALALTRSAKLRLYFLFAWRQRHWRNCWPKPGDNSPHFFTLKILPLHLTRKSTALVSSLA